MKILCYSDVHGNKYTLETLINSEDYNLADKKIFLGDLVNFCPYGEECINIIKNSNDILLKGNHDFYLSNNISNKLEGLSLFWAEHQKYTKNLLSNNSMEFLINLPYNYELKVENKLFYFTHYLWESDSIVAKNPDKNYSPSKKTAQIFDNIQANYIIFGHNHFPGMVEYNGKTFICVGSLGAKYPANYLVIDINNDEVKIEFKQLKYDIEKLKNEIKSMNYPKADTVLSFYD